MKLIRVILDLFLLLKNKTQRKKNIIEKGMEETEGYQMLTSNLSNKTEAENVDNDAIKLYSLIWKRTIASQMSNAQAPKS